MDIRTLVEAPVWEWPDDAATSLLATMRRGGAPEGDRVLAAELAGEIAIDDETVREALVALVGDEAEAAALRAAAAGSLGPVLEDWDLSLVDPGDADEVPAGFVEIRALLRRLYERAADGELRRRALEASVHAPEEWHLPAVRAAWADADPAWKTTAVFCMRFVRGFEEEIVAALRYDDPDVVYEAACAAGVWGVRPAWERIRALAVSAGTEKRTRIAAIEAVAAIRPDEAEGLLTEIDAGDDEEVAAAVDEALAMAGGGWTGDGLDDDDEQ